MMVKYSRIRRFTTIMLCILVLTLITISAPMIIQSSKEENKAPKTLPPSSIGLNGKIMWPRIGQPAIMLNGSELEVRVKAPSNITDWDFNLYREYRSYGLVYSTPSYQNGIWEINITIPSNAAHDLYDLRVSISDGVNETNLEEWNAIQVRHSFPSNFTIVHHTDNHFFSYPGSYSTKVLSVQQQAAMLNADLIIITGDQRDDDSVGSFILHQEILRQSRVPTLVLPGNHDRDSTGATFKEYKAYYGPDYYTANLGPDIFIVMANTYQRDLPHYRFNFTQLGWIENDMAASTAKTKILAGHAPLYYVDSNDYFLPESEALELQRICNETDVDLYLSGHLHNDRVDFINGTYYFITTSCGGSVWFSTSDPGHHRSGFRVLKFENYELVSYSWKMWNWSQPWDVVKLQRTPSYFRSIEKGGYLSIINNLSEPMVGHTVDFLVEPLTGPAVYRVSGATVRETVNGTDAWLIRLSVDLPINGTTTIRVYPSNAQAPTINSLTYNHPGVVLTSTLFYANITNPISGIQSVRFNMSFNNEPYTEAPMYRQSSGLYRAVKVFFEKGSGNYSVTTFDYAGYSSSSQWYNFYVTYAPTPPTLMEFNETSDDGIVFANWTASTDTDGTIARYLLQMSDTVTFPVILQEWNVTSTNYLVGNLTNGMYYFRVQAVDNLGAYSSWSNTENASVLIPLLPTTSPLDPERVIGTIIGAGITFAIAIVVVVLLLRRRKLPSS